MEVSESKVKRGKKLNQIHYTPSDNNTERICSRAFCSAELFTLMSSSLEIWKNFSDLVWNLLEFNKFQIDLGTGGVCLDLELDLELDLGLNGLNGLGT